MFSLEALAAKHGDCLFLHFGSVNNPKLIIIDGGPDKGGSAFNSALKPRLKEMAELLEVDLPIRVELLMVSHIDDDHIGGVLKLMKFANGAPDELVDIKAVWHNSFDDFMNTDQLDAISSFGNTSGSAAASFDPHTLNAAAGVAQGLELRDVVNNLGIIPNAGTGTGFVSAGDHFQIGDLNMRILGPAKEELLDLQDEFDRKNPNLASLTASERRAAIAEFTDKSIANLASIVVFAEHKGKSMLLTGDARGDKILEGLNKGGLLTNGKIKVDILKIPHHGSDRNMSTEFFQKVKAKHYVFSANGKDGNPDEATLQMLATARNKEKYKIWFTYRVPHVEHFFAVDQANHERKYEVEYRDEDFTSLWIDLEEELTF